MKYLDTVPELAERRVTVMGLGLFGGGLAVARFLCRRGAHVTVTDLKSAEALRESVAALEGFPVTLHLGGHDLKDFTDTDLLVVNPGVAPDSPWLAAAEKAGVPFESEMNLFWKLCPCPIAAVTGSNGKTTTTALLGAMIAAGTGRELIAHDAPWPQPPLVTPRRTDGGATRGCGEGAEAPSSPPKRPQTADSAGTPLVTPRPTDGGATRGCGEGAEVPSGPLERPQTAGSAGTPLVTPRPTDGGATWGCEEGAEAPSSPPKRPQAAEEGVTRGRGPGRVWVGGNIGRPLVEAVDLMTPGDWAVVEVSSFQCEALSSAKLHPKIAVVTNLQPNHLDRHGTMEAYEAAKFGITCHQTEQEVCVLNAGDARISGWSVKTKARKSWFHGSKPPTEDFAGVDEPISSPMRIFWDDGGIRRENSSLARRFGSFIGCMASLDGRRLIGGFNIENIAAAAAAAVDAVECGASEVASEEDLDNLVEVAFGQIVEVARTFPGVEHRLEFVATARGVSYYNDSIATNPDSVICALDALTAPVILLAGGSDKQLPFDRLGAKITERAKRCFLFGATADKILAAVTAAGGAAKCVRVPDLDTAVRESSRAAAVGDIVLLSPACASFDQFRNFAERGKRFKALVAGLQDGGSRATS